MAHDIGIPNLEMHVGRSQLVETCYGHLSRNAVAGPCVVLEAAQVRAEMCLTCRT